MFTICNVVVCMCGSGFKLLILGEYSYHKKLFMNPDHLYANQNALNYYHAIETQGQK